MACEEQRAEAERRGGAASAPASDYTCPACCAPDAEARGKSSETADTSVGVRLRWNRTSRYSHQVPFALSYPPCCRVLRTIEKSPNRRSTCTETCKASLFPLINHLPADLLRWVQPNLSHELEMASGRKFCWLLRFRRPFQSACDSRNGCVTLASFLRCTIVIPAFSAISAISSNVSPSRSSRVITPSR